MEGAGAKGGRGAHELKSTGNYREEGIYSRAMCDFNYA